MKTHQEELEIQVKELEAQINIKRKASLSSSTSKSYLLSNLFLSPGDMKDLQSSEKESDKKEDLQFDRDGMKDERSKDKIIHRGRFAFNLLFHQINIMEAYLIKQ